MAANLREHDLEQHDLEQHDLEEHDLEQHDLEEHDLEEHDLEEHGHEEHDLEEHGHGDRDRLECALEAAVDLLQRAIRIAAPDTVSGDRARGLVERFARAERTAAAGVALFTPVVVGTGSYAKKGHGSAADWLGSVSGTTRGSAKGRLAAAERAAGTPAVTEALHQGGLSSDQLEVVTKASAEAPEATGQLLELVEQGASHQQLTSVAARLVAGARSKEDERVRRARVHRCRHLRVQQADGGGIRGEFFCDEVAWAHVGPQLENGAMQRWKAAGAAGDSLEAYRLDVFLDRLAGSDAPAEGGGFRAPRSSRARALLIIDAESLRRGTTEGDEICEIEGIGPVSVEAATELLGQASVRYLVREGFDIKTVTKPTRVVTAAIAAALIVRDRKCVVPECGRRLGLERDHWDLDYAADGPTELDNLARLCPLHHDMKTNGGWRLGGGPGRWSWIPPRNPPSAGRIARNRKVAAAKGRARVAVSSGAKPRAGVKTRANAKTQVRSQANDGVEADDVADGIGRRNRGSP